MPCETHPATPAEAAELLAASGDDVSVTQQWAFGEALAGTIPRARYEPIVASWGSGLRAYVPIVRTPRRLRTLRCFEALPLSLNGSPVVAGGTLQRADAASIWQSLRPDSLHVHTAATVPPERQAALCAGRPLEGTSEVLELDGGFDTVWRTRFSKKVRNQARLAEKRGVEVRRAADPADFHAYDVLHAASAERWGYETAVYPEGFFARLAASASSVELRLAQHEGRAIAGVLLLHARQSTLYWSGAMLKEAAAVAPTTALLVDAIRDACAAGRQSFDLGSSGALESVRRFKESFGATPRPYRSWHFTTWRYRAYQLLAKAWWKPAR